MNTKKRLTIRVAKGKCGLDVFLDTGNESHYITTRRSNYLLWERLKNGVSLNDLKREKPRSSSRGEQKFYESTRYLLRVIDGFIKYELAA